MCALYKYKHSIEGSTYSPYQRRRPNGILEVISQQGRDLWQCRGKTNTNFLYIPSKGSSQECWKMDSGRGKTSVTALLPAALGVAGEGSREQN